MLIYVESKAFPSKTFTLVCNPHETVARARAQMLHILFELGRAEHQFRFRFKGEYLRDGYTFEDYRIQDNSVIKMVPMSKRKRGSYATVFGQEQSTQDVAGADEHVFSSRAILLGQEELDDVQKALRKEINIFERRETFLGNFKVLLWIHFLATVLSFTTIYWFSSFWTGALMLFGFLYCPNYTRLGGFVGKHGMNKNTFVIAFAGGGIMNVTASLLMGIYVIFELMAFECDNEESTCLRKKEQMYWSITFYLGQAFFLVCSVLICAILFHNFKTEVGDLIETHLVQIRDIDKVMKSAKTGSMKERRGAAFELASLAATGDDTKFRIVQEGGLPALMNLCLSQDQATQEYAIEAISELLTVPVIQDQFVELGGVRTMCALLHSKENRVVNEAVTALSYIVSDSEANRQVVIGENGLEDLCYVAERIQVPASRILAAIFLELVFTAEIRVMLSQQSAPATSLVHLCKLRDAETQRLALQTLELLAIENSDVIITHDALLELLLSLPNLTDDEQLFLLAGKIILYYAESELACQKLVEAENLKFCLMELAYSLDPLLQNVVAKIILAMIDSHGAVLEAAAVAQPRMEAIKWMSNQFAAFGYRDEWLADAILYMDRLAVQMYKSDNFLSLGVEPNSPAAEILGATEAMKSQDLWLAAVMVALKMSEAESELDTSIQDLVVPLVPFGPNGLKCTRARWQKIKLTEFFVVRELDSRLMVPTALHFVQHLSREVQRAAPANWPGLESVELPKLLGPPLSSKEQEEQKQKNAMPLRRLTKMQALAQCLADMAVVHKPSNVYGDKLSPAVLAVTVLRLCLYGWGCPPAGCEERLDELQEELGINSVPEEERQRLLAEVFRLWQRMPVGLLSPVTDRWRKRDLLGKLPPAPGQDSLPPLLQECCCFLTPRKKKQEPKDLSATPGSRPVQEDLASTNKAVDLPGTVPQSPEVRELFRDMPGVPAIPCMSGVPPVPVPAADDEALPAVDAAELAADPPVGEAMPVVVEENAASEPAMDVDDEVAPLLPLPVEKEDLETPQAAPEVPEEDDKHHPADLAAVRTSQPSEPIEVDDAEEVAFASAPAPAPASAPTLAQPTSRGTLSLVPFAKNRPGKSGSLGALAAVAATKALPKQETAGSNVWAPLDRIHEELGQPRQPMAPPAVSAPSTKAAQAMPGDAQKLAAPAQAKQVFPANSQSRKVAKAAKVKAKSTHARGRIGRLYRSPSGLSGHSSDTTFSPGPEESLPPPTVKKAPRKTKKRKKILQANPNLKKYKTPAAPMQVIPQTNLIRDAGQPFWTNRNVQPQHQVLQPANPAPAEPAVQAVPTLMGGRPAAEISRSRSGSDFARKMQKSQALSRKSRFEAALKGEDTQEIEEALADLEGEPSYFEDKEKADLRIQELEEFLERKLERATQRELVKGANLISQWRKHEERRSLERVRQSRANRQVMTLD